MKTDIIIALFLLLLIITVCSLVISKRESDTRKMMKEMRRQHERKVDRKVILGRGKRFDCPACGSTEPCGRCRLWCYHEADKQRS